MNKPGSASTQGKSHRGQTSDKKGNMCAKLKGVILTYIPSRQAGGRAGGRAGRQVLADAEIDGE